MNPPAVCSPSEATYRCPIVRESDLEKAREKEARQKASSFFTAPEDVKEEEEEKEEVTTKAPEASGAVRSRQFVVVNDQNQLVLGDVLYKIRKSFLMTVEAWRDQEEKNLILKIAKYHEIDMSGHDTSGETGRIHLKRVIDNGETDGDSLILWAEVKM